MIWIDTTLGDFVPAPMTDPREHESDGEHLRAELRGLGYLENPLSRFFAGGLVGKRPALRTHLRVGLAVGAAIGLAAALLTLPVLLASPRPVSPWVATAVLATTVVAAYLIGLLAAGSMFLIYRLTRRLIDRAELVARSAGVAAFVLAFVYLLSFWRRYGDALAPHALGAGGSGGAAALGACVVVAIALGVAWLFYLASFAVLAAIPGYGFARRRSGARRAFAIGVALAMIAAFAGVRMRPGDVAPEFAEKGEPITVERPIAKRVVLVAIDGLDFDNARAAIAAGWMPNLSRAMTAGWSTAVAATASDIPPAFWTTVATGLESHRHRIDAYFEPRVLGLSQAMTNEFAPPGLVDAALVFARVLGLAEEVPVIGSMSRLKRIGDVASQAGLSVASVNFWATYPVSTFGGTTISERAFHLLAATKMRGVPFDPEAASATELEHLEKFLFEENEVAKRVPAVAKAGLGGNFRTIHPLLYDLFVESAALDVLARKAPDYLQVCLTGLDVLRYHYLVREPARTDVQFAAHAVVLEGAHRALDDFLGELASAAGPDAIVAIATCPGKSGEGTAARGMLVMTGGAIRSGARAEALLPERIAPTLLAALGLPGSAEQDGRAEFAPFRDDVGGPRIERVLHAYGLKPELEIRDESSKEQLRYLNELGYLSQR